MRNYIAILLTILTFTNEVIGQDPGPAGIRDNNAPGAVYWLRADQGISLTAGEVTGWTDPLNGNNATPAGGQDGPAVNAGAINGFDALSFDGANQILNIPDDGRINVGNQNDISVFIAFSTPADLSGTTQEVIYEQGGAGNGLNFYIQRGATPQLIVNVWEAGTEYTVSFDVSINTNYIANLVFTGVGTNPAGTPAFAYLNNTTGAVSTSGTYNFGGNLNAHTGDIGIGGVDNATQYQGGNNQSGDNVDHFSGSIAELIYYDVALNDAERNILANYLSEKYAITLGSGDVYTEANYNNDIQGIGQAGGDLHTISLGNGGGLYLEGDASIITDGEFVLAGHDNNNFSQTSGNVSVSGVDRYNRSWFIEKTGTGFGADLIFNTSEVGLGAADDFGRVGSDYTLLYRATTGGLFTDVGVTATLEDDAGAGDSPSVSNDGNADVVFRLTDAQLQSGYYTLGVPENQTWYSYTTGNWNDPTSWTLDGSATPLLLNPGNEIPDANDNVVITNGRTITMDINDVVLQSAEVNGRLVLAATTGHDFNTINGNGTIRMSGDGSGNDNFPAGITTGANGFSNINNGGTLEIRGSGINLDVAREFNNVVVNMSGTADEAVLLADYTINSDLRITRGTFRFNNNTATADLNLDLFGNMVIAVNGSVRVGTGNSASTRHQFNLYGDFTNNGYAQFSDRTVQVVDSESTNGIVDFNVLSDNKDQDINCNASTYFYRIVIFKGTDDTYEARFDTNNSANFVLTGPVVAGFVGVFPDEPSDNLNAFAPITGNAVIGTDVVIDPLYADGAAGGEGSHFRIGENARLTVNGGTVAMRNNLGSITIYGVLDVRAGTVISEGNDGISLRLTGTIDISGGTVNTVNLKTASGSGETNFGGYSQSGGTVNVGEFAGSGGTNGLFHQFELPRPTQAFIMSGGTLNIQDPTGANRGLLFINSDPGNINVTGGTVNLITNNNNVGFINSKAPFYNLVITNTSSNNTARVAIDDADVAGVFAVGTVPAQDLVVLNDLTIQTGTTRNSGGNTYGSYLDLCPGGNCVDLEVGGDLRIEDSAVLDVWSGAGGNAGSATVTFNGSNDGILYIGDITTYSNGLTDYIGANPYDDWEHPFYNFTIDKPGAMLSLASKLPGKGNGPGTKKNAFNDGKNVTAFASNLVIINNELKLLSGTFSQIDPLSNVTYDQSGVGTYGSVGDPVAYSIRLFGTDVINQGNLFVYEDGVTPKEGIIVLRNSGNVTLNTTDGATFGNFRLLTRPFEVSITSDVEVGRLEIVDGLMDIGTHNLRVDVLESRVSNGMPEVAGGQPVFDTNNHFRMAGNASDGGLSVKVPRSVSAIPNVDEFENLTGGLQDDSREYNQTDRIWFPIGAGGKYTPAICHLHNNGTITGDEYITVRVVDQELQTTDLTGGDILSYYWNVGFEGYESGEEPTVSWLFQYDEADIDAGTESNYVPGKVLDGGDYTRSDEGGVAAVKNGGLVGNIEGNLLGNNPRNVIIFNGVGTSGATATDDDIETVNSALYDNSSINAQWATAWPNTGFTLENANYTAGVAARFVGAPDIYYARETARQNWSNQSKWTINPDGSNDGVNAGFPQVGDVAVLLRYDNADQSHWVNADVDIEIAELRFDDTGTGWRPRLWVDKNDASLNLGVVSGPGSIFVEVDAINTPTFEPETDLALWAEEANSEFIYTLDNNNETVNMINNISVYPNLRIEGQSGTNRILQTTIPITVNGRLRLDRGSKLRLNHDALVKDDALITWASNATCEIELGDDREIIFEVQGNLSLEDGDGNSRTARFTVANNNLSSFEHTVKIGGDILFEDTNNSSVFDLFNGTGTNNNAILELNGTGTNVFSNLNPTVVPDFYKIVMNKVAGTTTSFSFNNDFNIPTPATISAQPVEVLNGLLIFNNAGIAVTLTDAPRGNFFLPNTNNVQASSGSGGLEIAAGTVRVEGDDTGILLDGLLRISGGELDMRDATNNGNNFIEYSSSKEARIELSAGNLFVGSQVRRGLNSTTGVLQYSQTGGDALFGVNAAPESSRGVFEVLNAGSSFEYTGGAASTFSIVRDNNSSTVPTLRLSPTTHSIGDGNVIYIGTADTPDSADDDFGIYSDIPLDGLAIGQENSTIEPTAKIYGVPLEVNDLIIGNDGNSTFDARGFDLTVNESFTNEGTFIASGNSVNQQTTFFPSSAASTISSVTGNGSTTFYNFEKSGNGVLTVSKDLLVQNELRIESGTFATGSQAINVEGDVTNKSNHTATNTPPLSDLYGIILSGTSRQNLIGIGGVGNVSNFGVLAINNPEGALIQDGSEFTFEITDRLILEQGVLDISSNLFVFSENAIALNEDGNSGVNNFDVTNMIQTNSSFTDLGVRKKFTTGVQTDFLFPVGQQAYTPVEIDMTAALSGANATLTVRPANEPHPTVVGHDNSGGNSPGTLDDQSNVLQYHWILTSDGISSFTGDIRMRYDPTDVSFLNPGDATAAPLSFDVRNYAAARLLFSGTNWDKSFNGASFDQNNNLLIFSESSAFSGVGDNGITGDYTAGLLVEDDETTPLDVGAIPNTVLEYETSFATGNFTTNTDWVGINGAPPLAPGETPSGSIIYVRSGNQMNLTTPNARIYRTIIEDGGVLSIDENADNTRLGIVEGTGTLKIESNTVGQSPQLPAGFYGDFLTCSGGGLEYAGTVDYEVLANISQVREVIFSGSGDRELPNSNLLICDDFILRNGVSVTNSSNRQVTVQGDVIKSDGSTINFGTGNIILNGSAAQQIAGDYRGLEAFYNLEIDNSNGVTIVNSSGDATNGISTDVNGDVEISNQLTLTNGIVTTDDVNDLRLLFNSSIISPANGSTTTHVDGPLIRVLDRDLTGTFKYPIGDNGRNGYMEIDAPDINTQDDWKVEYFNATPSSNADIVGTGASFISTDATDNHSIQSASGNEYWAIEVNSAGSPSSNVILSWDLTSDVQDETNLEMLFWDATSGTAWDYLSRVSRTGNGTSGLLTAGRLSYSTKYVTFGTTDPTATPLPVELVFFTAESKSKRVELNWQTASEKNNDFFEIQRSFDGKEFEVIGVVEGNGDSQSTIDYSFQDYSPLAGDSYYRLRQVDYDGAFEYSEVVRIVREEASNLVAVPNPTQSQNIKLRLSGFHAEQKVQVTIFDLQGRRHYDAFHKPSDLNKALPISQDLNSGIYIIDVQQGNISKKVRLMVR